MNSCPFPFFCCWVCEGHEMFMIYLCSVFFNQEPWRRGVRAKLQFLSNFPGFSGWGDFVFSKGKLGSQGWRWVRGAVLPRSAGPQMRDSMVHLYQGGTVYGLFMVCLWFSEMGPGGAVYGLFMVCLWFSGGGGFMVYGLFMVCLWFFGGLFMVCLWFVYGFSGPVYGLLMAFWGGCLWFVYGLFMVFFFSGGRLWFVYGLFMVFWFWGAVYGLFMVFFSGGRLWGLFMVCLWFSGGLFMVCLWFSLALNHKQIINKSS